MAAPKYTDKQTRIARYAKALGNPARIAIMEFLAQQETCFFGEIHEILPLKKYLLLIGLQLIMQR